MQLPKYDSYKDSGVDWLGEIPEGWNLQKLKYLFGFSERGTAPTYADEGIPVISQSCISSYALNLKKAKYHNASISFQAYRGLLHKGDMLIASTGVGVLGKCALYDTDIESFADSHVTIVRDETTHVTTKYLFYLLSVQYDMINACLSEGATKQTELQRDRLRSLLLPVPSPEDQERIIAFLDQKTAEIDEAIAKKQKLIERLQEQKSILINQAVTKGLNPDAPMKESGVEWIGEIPAHWELQKAKVLFDKTQHPVHSKDGIVTAFRDGEVTLRTNRRTEGFTIALLEQGYQGVRSGQLVVNSMDAFAGAIGISDSDGKCSPEYVVCDATKPSESYLPFYAYLLRNMAEKGYIQAICPAVRQRALRFRYPNLAPVLLPAPHKEEQKQIVEVIEITKSNHDEAIKHLADQIALLVEFKQTLISLAVTGKIKV